LKNFSKRKKHFFFSQYYQIDKKFAPEKYSEFLKEFSIGIA